MKIFEVHITGGPEIKKELDALGVKNIVVELLKPNHDVLRTEYMSSYIVKHETHWDCYDRVASLVNYLRSYTDIIRVKIETPYYPEYLSKALYIESHFAPTDNSYPISRNKGSQKLMGTDREYDVLKFDEFRKKWAGQDIELCIFDSYIDEDFDWMKLYNK